MTRKTVSLMKQGVYIDNLRPEIIPCTRHVLTAAHPVDRQDIYNGETYT